MADSAAVSPVYLLDQLDLDYRPEVVAAGLLAGQDPPPLSRLIFQPTGPVTRPYAKDVGAPQPLATAGPAGPYVLLSTPREGIYDQLPPFLFHAIPPTAGPAPDPEAELAHLRRERVVEQETRRFFLPFDTELYYLRLLRYERERQADQLAEAPVLREEFARSWLVLRRLDASTASLFMQVLPFIHQLRGDVAWLGRFLAVVFGVPMRFEAEQPIVHQVADAPALGYCLLGINSLIGNTFSDGYNALHLYLGPVPAGRVAEFLPASAARELLHELLGYFLPASLEVRLFVGVERPAAGPPAEEEGAPLAPLPPTYLGYNSFLTGGRPRPAGPAAPQTYRLTTKTFPVVIGLRQRWPAWSRRLAWTV